MSLVHQLHGRYVYARRVERLCSHVADLIPPSSTVLDVGSGDGLIARRLQERRPDLQVTGVDVLPRRRTHIPVELYDGRRLPREDASTDVVTFVDVLHHVEEPLSLLQEGARVARLAVVIKDHTANGLLARPTLRFMDRVGNARHGVSLPYNYWPRHRWLATFESLGLKLTAWRADLDLYPRPLKWLFERRLHFVCRLEVPEAALEAATA